MRKGQATAILFGTRVPIPSIVLGVVFDDFEDGETVVNRRKVGGR